MSTFDITNLYEARVIQAVRQYAKEHFPPDQAPDSDLLEDVVCLALNQLPARYVRHQVYAMFYLSGAEQKRIDQAIKQAVSYAFAHVAQDFRSK
ncbi:late competence development ComFB family protein [Thiorhodospira sibirica]|uniref:late competence development ComFB family protein n=1 Tax=Thiorhodospira sibirica TaxID=154347 RepID=UPI00022C4643|nr:late competence development ComFB family protein [Thiorhodospira sibirica]